MKLKAERGAVLTYYGKILAKEPDILVSFLPPFRRHQDILDILDASVVFPDEIVGKLKNVQKMRRGQIKFL